MSHDAVQLATYHCYSLYVGTTPLNADVHCNGYAHEELVTLEKYVLSVASQLASA